MENRPFAGGMLVAGTSLRLRVRHQLRALTDNLKFDDGE
jgi:hypothetical protein